jgi:hypothetical protein
MDSFAPDPPSAAAGSGCAREIAGTRAVLRIWQTGIDESRADEYREFARRRSTPMFSSQPGFLVGASHVEIFELEGASLDERLSDALSRVGDADSEVTGRRPGG